MLLPQLVREITLELEPTCQLFRCMTVQALLDRGGLLRCANACQEGCPTRFTATAIVFRRQFRRSSRPMRAVSCCLFHIGSWKLEVGSWKLEVGSWKLEVGSWNRHVSACPVTDCFEIVLSIQDGHTPRITDGMQSKRESRSRSNSAIFHATLLLPCNLLFPRSGSIVKLHRD